MTNKETFMTVALVAIEFIALAAILMVSVATYNEVKRDPLDVNGDGEANIVDLSVLAAELNAK